MKKRSKVVWTRQARDDLRAIRTFIARDAPIAATTFVRRLRTAAERLESLPESGQIVSELSNPAVREIIHGHYRIIYRTHEGVVEIVTVYHGSRMLDEHGL